MTRSPGVPGRQIRWGVRILFLVSAAVILWRVSFMLAAARPVGLVDGRLRACPPSPNCVCSQEADADHSITPLRFQDAPNDAWQRLQRVLQTLPRTRVVSSADGYLHVEFTTALLRFVDDVEFLQDPSARVIHVRSASRVGYSDLGANRKRIEQIRKLFELDLHSGP